MYTNLSYFIAVLGPEWLSCVVTILLAEGPTGGKGISCLRKFLIPLGSNQTPFKMVKRPQRIADHLTAI
jgi:hypothetical protein